MEPEVDPYRGSYINEYHSHPSLGRSPGGSVSPPRHSQGRPSRSSSPTQRHHYNTPGRASPMGRPSRDGGSPPHHEYNGRPATHHSEAPPYRGEASPPYYRKNPPSQHHDNGAQRRVKVRMLAKHNILYTHQGSFLPSSTPGCVQTRE